MTVSKFRISFSGGDPSSGAMLVSRGVILKEDQKRKKNSWKITSSLKLFCCSLRFLTPQKWPSWWFQPSWKILVNWIGWFPHFRGENKKSLKPPPSGYFWEPRPLRKTGSNSPLHWRIQGFLRVDSLQKTEGIKNPRYTPEDYPLAN